MLKTILSFIFLFGRRWLTVCANKITTVFSYWLDSFLPCSVRLFHAITFFPNTVLYRGPYAVRSRLNTRIRNQAEQRQGSVDVALIGHPRFEFLQYTFRTLGFHHQKSQQLLKNAGFVQMRLEALQRAKSSPASLTSILNPRLCSTGIFLQLQNLNPSFKGEKTIPVCSTASVNTPY